MSDRRSAEELFGLLYGTYCVDHGGQCRIECLECFCELLEYRLANHRAVVEAAEAWRDDWWGSGTHPDKAPADLAAAVDAYRAAREEEK